MAVENRDRKVFGEKNKQKERDREREKLRQKGSVRETDTDRKIEKGKQWSQRRREKGYQ